MKDNKILGWVFIILIVMLIIFLGYNTGLVTILNYKEYGLGVTILSYVIGIPLMIFTLWLVRIFERKLNK